MHPTATPSAPRTLRRRLAAVLVASATAFAGLGLVAPAASAAPRPSATAPAGLISYIATAPDGTSQVFTMKADGTAKTQVTSNTTNTKKCDPMLNPTRSDEVTYAANDGKMYVHSLAAPSVATVISPPVAEGKRGGGRRPTFSADGNTIVFHFTIDADAALPTYDLYITNRGPDGWSLARQITKLGPGESAWHPRYSLATGDHATAMGNDWLAYTYKASADAPYDLYVVQVPSNKEGLAPGVGVTGPIGDKLLDGTGGTLASWSKNGNKLAYVKSCSAAVEYVTVTANADKTALSVVGGSVAVARSGGCGLSWSSHSNDHLVYADTGRIYVKNVATTQKATAIGTGSMPSW